MGYENKKMKILYILPACGSGGPIRQITYILRYLDRAVYEPFIITVYKEDVKNSRLEEIKRYGKYRYIPTSKVEMVFGRNIKLKKEIDKINPDVIHSVGVFPDYFVSRFFGDIQVHTIRNDLHDFRKRYGVFRGYIMLKMCLFSYKKSHETFVCSHSLSQLCNKEFHMELKVIRNGVDVGIFSPCFQKEIMRERLELPQGSIIFIMSGRIYDIKNQSFLLEGFSNAFGNDNRVCLVLLGDGPLKAKLCEKYKEYSNILFRGIVQNVDEYLGASDIYVSTSKTEGMPNGVLEGMASGLAVLLSDIPQHEEIYHLNSNIGWLYHSGDLNDFVSKLRDMVRIDLKNMKQQSMHTVAKNMSAEYMSSEYQRAYLAIRKKD